MNLNNVEFYNLGALEEIPGYGTNGLVRIPAKIRNLLNERARFVGMDSVGIELRFVTDAPNIDLYISTDDPITDKPGQVRIYKGNFLHQTIEIPHGITKVCRINPPEKFEIPTQSMLYQAGFSPDVWRIICDNATFVVHGISVYGHDIRAPKKDEIPQYNWLAYGSSITNSSLDGYPHFAASKLKVQVQNKGFSGACYIEKELVDYLLDECSFDFITCELGVNMRGRFTPSEFEKRASYLIDRLANLGKPALIISIFPNSHSLEYIKNENEVSNSETSFNNILVKLVKAANCPYIKLIHGHDILDDVNGLSADLIHPTSYGHALMGTNLAKYLKLFLLDFGINI